MNFILFILFTGISSLSLRKLDVQVCSTYRFELPPNGILEFVNLIEKYRLPKKNYDQFTNIAGSDGIECGYLWSSIRNESNKIKETRNLLIKEKYFTSNNKNISSVFFIRTLYPNCRLVYRIPDITLNDKERAGCSIKVKAKNIDSSLLFENNFMEFLNTFGSKREMLLKTCFKICKDLNTKCIDGLHGFLQIKKYIFLFFKKDLIRIEIFFKTLYEIILETTIIPRSAIYDLFDSTVLEYIDEFIDMDWVYYFEKNNITERQQKKIIQWFLLTDVMNLINLANNRNYKFCLVNTSKVNEDLMGESTILLEVDLLKTPKFDRESILIKEQHNETVECDQIIINDGIMYFAFNTNELIERDIKNLSVSILTSDGIYESERLEVSEFY